MIENLNQREKVFLAGGAVALLLLLIIFGIILPYRSSLSSLDDQITLRQKQLREVQQLQGEFQRLKAELSQREQKLSRNEGASAFSAIESIVSSLGIRDKLVAMRPQPTSQREEMQVETVAARIERVDLEQLVRLLKAFETSKTLLNVTSMQIRQRFDDNSLLDAEIKIETLKRSS